jgi:hypothetical protein
MLVLAVLGVLLAATSETQGQLGGHGFSKTLSEAEGSRADKATFYKTVIPSLASPQAGTGEESAFLPKDEFATSVPIAPEGRPVAVIEPASDDELLITAAFSPDGRRLAYGTERRVQRRAVAATEDLAYFYPGEVWVTDFTGKPKRVLKHDFLRSAEGGFLSFSVERVAWSLDASKLLIEISDERKRTATFFFSAEGKRVKLGGSGPNVAPGYGGAWLADHESVGLLTEEVSPRLLHRIHLLRATAGRAMPLFGSKVFAAVAWLPRSQKVAAIERDKEFSRPPRLVLGNLDTGTLEDLGAVPDYAGGLRALPDERRVSYFIGNDKLAVRALTPDAQVEVLPVPLGRYEWTRLPTARLPDGPGQAGPNALVFLQPRNPGERTGRLVLYDTSTGEKHELLKDEEDLVQDFWLSPDGAQVAILTSGDSPLLKIYWLR